MRTADNPGSAAASIELFDPWYEHERCAHVVQFYAEDGPLLSGLSRFIGTALGSGDAAIVIATKSHRDRLAQQLKARGLDTDRAVHQGRYVALDAAKMLSKFMVDEWPDEAQFAGAIGKVIAQARAAVESAEPRVAAFGEMVALLWAQGKTEAAGQLEQLWNRLTQTHTFYLRCAYPLKAFSREEDGEAFLKICAEHSGVIPSESYTELISAHERLRKIASLQQKAQALEAEKTRLKEAQESLQRREHDLSDLLENAAEGVQQVDSDQRIRWANRALLNLLGYATDEVASHQLSEFFVHRHIFDKFWRKLMRREDTHDYPAELRCKDGSVKHVLIHSSGFWERGRFIHARCFVRDVTEQRRMEQALHAAERNATMGKLAAVIAHEINNPLETITSVLYLLRGHPSLDEQARDLTRIAGEEISRVTHIVKRTLSFYRETEKPVPVSLSQALQEVLDVYARQLHLRGISAEKRFAADVPVMAFPVEIRQVFLNLIGNAFQAMPEGGKLRVTLRYCSKWIQDSRRSGVRVNITDTGVGIPVEYRDKIFQPFVTTKPEKGTGLGLWISRSLIQKLSGTIRFRSFRVRGWARTSFAVFIPMPTPQQVPLSRPPMV